MARPLRLDPGGALSTPLTVPPGLRELAAERIDPLSTSAREVVIAAAALFRPTVAEVAASLNRPNEIESDLLEAERAGILTSHEGRIRFTHPLIASAAYGSAPDAERRRLHRRLAEVVRDPEERARHLARCATEADSWTASEIERAARRAAFGGAQDAAAELFDAAVRLTPQDEHDERARRLLGQAAALNAVGDFAAARALAEQAHDSARAGATQVAVCALLANLAWFAGDARTATSYLEDASRASGDDDELRGATQAKLVRYTFTDDFARAVAHADEAIPLLPEDTQPFLLAHILIDRFFGSVLLGRPSPRRTFDRALRLEEAALRTAVEPPHPIPLIWFLCVDEFDAAQARFHLEHEWYRDRGEEIWQANRLAHVALVELRSGRWEVAERYVEESCAALEEVEVHGPMALVFEKRALVDAHLGRADRGRETLLPLIDEFERRGQAYWAALCLSTLAFVEFSAGDHAATDRALSRMREHTDRLGIKDNIHDRSEPFHIESLLALGETNHARRVLAELESRQRVLPRPWIAATLPRAQALVAAADGDVDGALRRLEVADPHLDGLLPFEHGWTLLVDGRLLRRAKRKRAAADALDRAREIFERLGAASWVERVRAESSRLGIRPSAPLELTESERRVAELVARGLRNREVATRLFMSPKTVEANLGRVYRKLGIHSRAELGAELAGGPDPPAAP
jgi:DNA-binding CsgD family transcriptional regulator